MRWLPQSGPLWVLALVACSGDGGGDAPVQTPSIPCADDTDCNNGLFCDGEEICVEGVCRVSETIGCNDGVDCTTDTCSNELQSCIFQARDADGDGHADQTCLDGQGVALGDDCDDADPNRFPGNTEVCDPNGHDEDCDGATFGASDEDEDGFISDHCCNGSLCGSDCDDFSFTAKPGGVEVCDGRDNDCDGTPDEGVTVALFRDVDGDGFGDPGAPVSLCAGASGASSLNTDCDDTDAARHPGQLEICDNKDNDCDLGIDESPQVVTWYPDLDQDGFGNPAGPTVESCVPPLNHALLPTDCDDADPARSPVAPELCDGIDNDCDGEANFALGVNDFEDDDGDGLVDAACVGGNDCDDGNPLSGPGMPEQCDGLDNDCDGRIDESAVLGAWFVDLDRDGFGAAQSGVVVACVRPSPAYAAHGGDCDDTDDTRFPENEERCNGADDDCDLLVDEGTDFLHDAQNCGACGQTCDETIASHHWAGTCSMGGCECVPGWGDCDGARGNGCEVDLDTTVAHCGACGAVCALPGALPTCDSGACEIAVCFDGLGDCNGQHSDGCEQSLLDVAHCGGCGVSCAATLVNVSTALCTSAGCDYDSCTGSFLDCDGNRTNGCEAPSETDAANCGACGNDCSQVANSTGGCAGGTCVCQPLHESCDGQAWTGCETDLRDPTTCGTTCLDKKNCTRASQNGTALCLAGGVCDVTCDTDRANCGNDGDPLTCETSLGTVDDCGACDDSCVVGGQNGTPFCVRSDGGHQCAALCDFGYADCDVEPLDCETDVTSDENHCGGCNVQCGNGESCVASVCETESSGGVGGPLAATEVVVGGDFSCALSVTGTVYCWGGNAVGQLGDGEIVSRHTPAPVVAITGTVQQIFAGSSHACALVEAGDLYCWGSNVYGEAGQPQTALVVPTPTVVPMFMPNLSDRSVALGDGFSCARSGSDVYCWGRNDSAQLGQGHSLPQEDPHLPIQVTAIPSTVVGVRAGRGHACVDSSASEIYCWGNNEHGQLADGGPVPGPNGGPIQTAATGAVEWACGSDHCCYLDPATGVWCWGSNTVHQSGDTDAGLGFSAPVPTMVGGVEVSDMSAGYGASYVVDNASGTALAWGDNGQAAFGNGTIGVPTEVPNEVNPPQGVNLAKMARGGGSAQHMCAIDDQMQVYCWGKNGQGQTGRVPMSTTLEPQVVLVP